MQERNPQWTLERRKEERDSSVLDLQERTEQKK